MLDTILDLFDRRRKGDDRASGSGGLLARLGGLVDGDHDDDRRPHRGRRDDGWRDDGDGDDDGDDRGRRRAGRRDEGFDFG